MYVPMQLSRVLITEFSGDQYIFLQEVDGDRTFPIVIGINEALAIDRRWKGHIPPRPMTHELLADVIDAFGATIEKIHIEDLRQLDPADARQTFIAKIFLLQGERRIEVDSRPSDAIALGSAFNTPIYVAESVLDGVFNVSPEDRIGMLREHQKVLRSKIEDLTGRLHDEEFVEQAPPDVIDKAREHLQRMRAEHDAIQRVLEMFD